MDLPGRAEKTVHNAQATRFWLLHDDGNEQ
jgi:hypothetical protein